MGGPVIKDKLFYFFTYEGSRKVNPITYTSTTFNGPQACLAAIPSATCAAANAYIASQLGALSTRHRPGSGLRQAGLSVQLRPTISARLSTR